MFEFMKLLLLSLRVAVGLGLYSLEVQANRYESCKEILREGLRDTVSSRASIDHRVASHIQFCNIAHENHLDDHHFYSFVRSYAKQVNAKRSSVGVGASIGIGPFSFGENVNTSNANAGFTEDEKANLLQTNRHAVMQYF